MLPRCSTPLNDLKMRAFVFSAFLTGASAFGDLLPRALGDMPSCASNCVLGFNSKGNCAGYVKCSCQLPNFSYDWSCCVEAACSSSDAQLARDSMVLWCNSVSIFILFPDSVSCASNTSTSSTSTTTSSSSTPPSTSAPPISLISSSPSPSTTSASLSTQASASTLVSTTDPPTSPQARLGSTTTSSAQPSTAIKGE
jgi:hypothetical protein